MFAPYARPFLTRPFPEEKKPFSTFVSRFYMRNTERFFVFVFLNLSASYHSSRDSFQSNEIILKRENRRCGSRFESKEMTKGRSAGSIFQGSNIQKHFTYFHGHSPFNEKSFSIFRDFLEGNTYPYFSSQTC